ncbi:MAG: hypothetical protein P4M12_07670 [Gammaproteobacteria bacterium]|nr:hypothetical protein [Gammaproteobacteria bacterium]
MKNCLIITLMLSFVSLSSLADTCPPIQGLDPQHPPAGWEMRPSPYSPEEHYYFGIASHSFMGNEDFKKIYCRYEACPGILCPSFVLASTQQYDKPYFEQNPPAPWNTKSSSQFVINCRPGDNNPAHCVFE